MKKILITGGAGFIGSHVCEYFYNAYPKLKLVIIDKVTYSANKKYLSKIIKDKARVKFIKKDILEISNYIKYFKNAEYAINLAAESHVDSSFLNARLYTRSNTLGCHEFLISCLKANIKNIMHISTDEIYGEKIKGKSFETDNFNPTNPYSASKAAAEMIFSSYKYFKKNNFFIVRSNNIYGTRQFPEKLIPHCIVRSLKKKKIKIHGNGKNKRSYLSVYDFASALKIIFEKGKSGTYNIGTSEMYSNLTIAKHISRLMNIKKNNILFVKDRPFNDKKYNLDNSKIKKIGWQPKKKLLSELPNIIKWYQRNLSFYKK